MIKRNPYYKTTASIKRIKEVKDLLADVGIRLYNDRDSEEFQVYPIGDVRGGKRTYFTLDRSAEGLEDALQTGLDMARKMKKEKVANPRCRTFQVKRKVGKRTIQVKRKVCNPKKNYEMDHEADFIVSLKGFSNADRRKKFTNEYIKKYGDEGRQLLDYKYKNNIYWD